MRATCAFQQTLILNFQQVKRPNQERKDVKGKKGGVKAKPGLCTGGGLVAETCLGPPFLVGVVTCLGCFSPNRVMSND